MAWKENDEEYWARKHREHLAEMEHEFRQFVARSLAEARGLYRELGLNPEPDLDAVIDQALATPERREAWEERSRKARHIREWKASGRDPAFVREGLVRPRRRSFK